MHDDPVADVISRLDVPVVPSAEFTDQLWMRLQSDLSGVTPGAPARRRPNAVVVLAAIAASLFLAAVSSAVLREEAPTRRVITEPSTGASTTSVPDAAGTGVAPDGAAPGASAPVAPPAGIERRTTRTTPTTVGDPSAVPLPVSPADRAQVVDAARSDQWIAFRRDVNGDRSIWVMKLDGSHARKVGTGTMPSWSPGGRELAIVEAGALKVLDVDTGRLRTFDVGTQGVVRDPAWSPDGSTIAVQVTKGDALGGCTVGPCSNEIWLVAADGSSSRLLRSGASPSWSPDGRRLVFTEATNYCGDELDHCYGSLGIVNVDGTGLDFPGQFVAQPSFSPDGQHIVYQREYQFDTDVIEVTDAQGRDAKQVAGGPTGNQWTPAWTPDGRVIFCSAYTNACALRIVNADGTGMTERIGGEEMRFDEYPSVVRRAGG